MLQKQMDLNVGVAEPELRGLAESIQNFLNQSTFEIAVQARAVGGEMSGSVPSAVPGFAGGGRIPGTAPHSRADNVIARVTPGEYVHQVAAVRHYGLGFMERINRLQYPAFADGGLVDGAGGGEWPGTRPDRMQLDISINGGRAHSVFGERDQLESLIKALRSET